MSNRKTLIDALHNITSATLPELVDVTGWPERKVRDTISDCRTAGLILSVRDDVTNKPLYRLTKDGATWQTPTAGKKKSSVTLAGSGGNNPGSHRPHHLPCDSLGGAKAVASPPVPDDLPALADADEIHIEEIIGFDLEPLHSDRDPHAVKRSRIISSVSSDGQTTIHRFGDGGGLVLTAEETRQVYEFMAQTARIWGAVL